ncbi:DUF4885 domain-containing protein [Bacillus licheniformis]|nr:DUF4885 domain-containing protein [Bacillus licheniformis]
MYEVTGYHLKDLEVVDGRYVTPSGRDLLEVYKEELEKDPVLKKTAHLAIAHYGADYHIAIPADAALTFTITPIDYQVKVSGTDDEQLIHQIEQILQSGENSKQLFLHIMKSLSSDSAQYSNNDLSAAERQAAYDNETEWLFKGKAQSYNMQDAAFRNVTFNGEVETENEKVYQRSQVNKQLQALLDHANDRTVTDTGKETKINAQNPYVSESDIRKKILDEKYSKINAMNKTKPDPLGYIKDKYKNPNSPYFSQLMVQNILKRNAADTTLKNVSSDITAVAKKASSQAGRASKESLSKLNYSKDSIVNHAGAFRRAYEAMRNKKRHPFFWDAF